MLDTALRLHLTEDHVRGRQHTAEWAMTQLWSLWQQALDGFATLRQVDQAITLLSPLTPPADAPQEIIDAVHAVDPLTAKQVFIDAKTFGRVIH